MTTCTTNGSRNEGGVEGKSAKQFGTTRTRSVQIRSARISRVTGHPRPRVSLLWRGAHTALPCVSHDPPGGSCPLTGQWWCQRTPGRISASWHRARHSFSFLSFATTRWKIRATSFERYRSGMHDCSSTRRELGSKSGKETGSKGEIIGNRGCPSEPSIRSRIPIRG